MTRKIAACAVVGALLLCGAVAVADSDHRRVPTIAGTWLVKVLFAEGTPFETKLQYVQTFNQDGRTTLLLPTGGPPDYPETGDPRVGCMGDWKARTHTGRWVFDMMLVCLPASSGSQRRPHRTRRPTRSFRSRRPCRGTARRGQDRS